jgi:uncharacterized protein
MGFITFEARLRRNAPHIAAAFALSIAALVSGAARAQSFPCAQAQTQAQLAICNSEDLLVLDENLSAMFARRLGRAGNFQQKQAVTLEQSQWMVERDRCGANQACLASRYRARISDIAEDGLLAAIARIGPRQP